ncbi:MAG: type II secretion system F family protein, partial [Chloroflexota bacterium]|nr:type II secretion system F family protein [Chloroflexota bacterium]
RREMSLALLGGMLLAFSIIAFFIGVQRILGGDESIESRLELYGARAEPTEGETEGVSPLATRLNRWIATSRFVTNLAADLSKANLPLTVPEFVLLNIGLALILFLVGILISHRIPPGLMLGAVGFIAPKMYLKLRQRRRQAAFAGQLTDVLTLLAGSLRAGHSFLHSMDVVVREMPSPASQEFRRVVDEVGLGLSQQEALDHLVQRMESDDLELIVTAIDIQHEVGGNLANILDTITETIRERVRIKGEIKTLTTQQRATGYILSFLPFIVGGIIFLINPDYMKGLTDMLCIPGGALIAIIVGFMIMRKIVSIEI